MSAVTSLREGSQTVEGSSDGLLPAGMILERDTRSHRLHPTEIEV